MEEYTDDQIYAAMRAADAAGDGEAVKALAAALQAGKSADEIETIAANKGFAIQDKAALAENVRRQAEGLPTSEPRVVQPRTVAGDLQDSGIATLKGAAKAVAGPYDLLSSAAGGVQQGMNSLLTEAVAMPAEALGANAFADWWRGTGEQNALAIDRAGGNMSVRNALDTLVPTPQGMENVEFASELVAGLAVPLGPKGKVPITAPKPAVPATEAQAIIAEGVKRGVPVKTTDVVQPKSGMGRYVKQTLPEKIPFAGMSGPRQAQQEARQQAVVDIVEEFGGNTGRELFDVAGNGVEDIAKALTAERSQRLTTLTAAKNSVIDGTQGTAPVSNTLKAFDDQIAAMIQRDTPASREVAEILKAQKAELVKPRTLRGLEDFRKDELSKVFDSPDTLAAVKTVGEQALRKIYDPLRRDMGDFIETQAGAGARNRWSKANEQLSAMAGELTSARFRNVLRDADTTPEAVGRILFGSPDNVSDAKRLVANLNPAGKKKVQGALLQRAFDAAGGSDGVSVERFLGNLKRLSGQIGVAFEGQDRASIEGLRKLLEATRRGAEAGANVRTGEQNLPAVMGIAVTQVLGASGGIATLGVGGLIARLYESPLVRDHLVRLARTKAGSPQEARTLALIMRSATPTVNAWQDNIARAVNDNPSANLAAEEQPDEPN